MRDIFLLISMVFVIAGCGGGGSGGSDTPGSDQKPIVMVVNKNYTLHHGERIEKKSNDAIVKLETNLSNKQTIATLQQGAAVIVQ